jgi:hypothetical protein
MAIVYQAESKMDDGQLADAHLLLSKLYRSPDLPTEESPKITKMLDQLAGLVIYSRRHLQANDTYKVQPGDTLDRIAAACNVPPQLLARINGIREPDGLRPGRDLKVVSGPFRAVVSLDKFELTLMLQDRYAGRFPIGLGTDNRAAPGTYTVRDKRVNPVYQGPGREIAGGSPDNPLGKFSLELGNQLAIHGTNDPQALRRADNRGSICLSDRDIDDVFGILSLGSEVIIER